MGYRNAAQGLESDVTELSQRPSGLLHANFLLDWWQYYCDTQQARNRKIPPPMGPPYVERQLRNSVGTIPNVVPGGVMPQYHQQGMGTAGSYGMPHSAQIGYPGGPGGPLPVRHGIPGMSTMHSHPHQGYMVPGVNQFQVPEPKSMYGSLPKNPAASPYGAIPPPSPGSLYPQAPPRGYPTDQSSNSSLYSMVGPTNAQSFGSAPHTPSSAPVTPVETPSTSASQIAPSPAKRGAKSTDSKAKPSSSKRTAATKASKDNATVQSPTTSATSTSTPQASSLPPMVPKDLNTVLTNGIGVRSMTPPATDTALYQLGPPHSRGSWMGPSGPLNNSAGMMAQQNPATSGGLPLGVPHKLSSSTGQIYAPPHLPPAMTQRGPIQLSPPQGNLQQQQPSSASSQGDMYGFNQGQYSTMQQQSIPPGLAASMAQQGTHQQQLQQQQSRVRQPQQMYYTPDGSMTQEPHFAAGFIKRDSAPFENDPSSYESDMYSNYNRMQTEGSYMEDQQQALAHQPAGISFPPNPPSVSSPLSNSSNRGASSGSVPSASNTIVLPNPTSNNSTSTGGGNGSAVATVTTPSSGQQPNASTSNGSDMDPNLDSDYESILSSQNKKRKLPTGGFESDGDFPDVTTTSPRSSHLTFQQPLITGANGSSIQQGLTGQSSHQLHPSHHHHHPMANTAPSMVTGSIMGLHHQLHSSGGTVGAGNIGGGGGGVAGSNIPSFAMSHPSHMNNTPLPPHMTQSGSGGASAATASNNAMVPASQGTHDPNSLIPMMMHHVAGANPHTLPPSSSNGQLSHSSHFHSPHLAMQNGNGMMVAGTAQQGIDQHLHHHQQQQQQQQQQHHHHIHHLHNPYGYADDPMNSGMMQSTPSDQQLGQLNTSGGVGGMSGITGMGSGGMPGPTVSTPNSSSHTVCAPGSPSGVLSMMDSGATNTMLSMSSSSVGDSQKLTSLMQEDGDSAGADGELQPAYIPTEMRIMASHSSKVLVCAFDMSGQYLATGGGGADPPIRIWNVETGEVKLQLKGHTHNITGLKWSTNPQTPLLLLSCGLDTSIRLWDIGNPESPEVNMVKHHTPLQALDWHPTAVDRFACADHHDQLLFWYMKDTLGIVSTPTAQMARMANKQIRYSPSGRLIACGMWADQTSSLKIVDVDHHKVIHDLSGHERQIIGIHWIDDSMLISTSEDVVRVWKLGTSAECIRHFSAPGDKTYYAITHPKTPNRVLIGAFQKIYDWDYTSNKHRSLQCHEGIVSCLAYSHSSDILATTSHDKLVKLWKIGSN